MYIRSPTFWVSTKLTERYVYLSTIGSGPRTKSGKSPIEGCESVPFTVRLEVTIYRSGLPFTVRLKCWTCFFCETRFHELWRKNIVWWFSIFRAFRNPIFPIITGETHISFRLFVCYRILRILFLLNVVGRLSAVLCNASVGKPWSRSRSLAAGWLGQAVVDLKRSKVGGRWWRGGRGGVVPELMIFRLLCSGIGLTTSQNKHIFCTSASC